MSTGFKKEAIEPFSVGAKGEIGSISIKGREYSFRWLGPDTSPGDGIDVTICEVSGENLENRDFADIRIKSGVRSPVEFFNTDLTITDWYLGGKGAFFAEDPGGNVYCTIFNDLPEQIGMTITYGKGWKQCWAAFEDGSGIRVLESCVPPWPKVIPYEIIEDPSVDNRLSEKARELYRTEVLPRLQQ